MQKLNTYKKYQTSSHQPGTTFGYTRKVNLRWYTWQLKYCWGAIAAQKLKCHNPPLPCKSLTLIKNTKLCHTNLGPLLGILGTLES